MLRNRRAQLDPVSPFRPGLQRSSPRAWSRCGPRWTSGVSGGNGRTDRVVGPDTGVLDRSAGSWDAGVGWSLDEKNVEFAAVRHQIAVVNRQVERLGLPSTTDWFWPDCRGFRRVGGLPRHPGDAIALAPLPDLPEVYVPAHRHLARAARASHGPCVPGAVEPTRGYQQIVGEARKVGVRVSASSVRSILRRNGRAQAPCGNAEADFSLASRTTRSTDCTGVWAWMSPLHHWRAAAVATSTSVGYRVHRHPGVLIHEYRSVA